MKKTLLAVVIVAFAATLFTACTPAATSSKPVVRHVVSFKYKDNTPDADIQKVEDAFRALKTKVPGIVSFECGKNISPEKLNKGFTHLFILTFNNEADRDAYLVHPDHKAFCAALGAVADVFVMDIQAKP